MNLSRVQIVDEGSVCAKLQPSPQQRLVNGLSMAARASVEELTRTDGVRGLVTVAGLRIGQC
jgi:hypothetical protein